MRFEVMFYSYDKNETEEYLRQAARLADLMIDAGHLAEERPINDRNGDRVGSIYKIRTPLDEC